MSAIEDWKALVSGLDPGPGHAVVSDHNESSWSLVFARRGRVLALPSSRLADPDSLDFFLNTISKWWWAQLSMLCQKIAPRSLPQVHFSTGQDMQLRRMLFGVNESSDPLSLDIQAIHFGSRGPLQKVLILGGKTNGQRTVVKLALRASADNQIAAEAEWLQRIATYTKLAGHVPVVSDTGNTPSGRPYFVMNAIVGKPSATSFGTEHIELLRRIGLADYRTDTWQTSPLFRSIETRLDALNTAKASDLEILRGGWSASCRALAERPLPLCLNQGDFAAWNILQTGRGLLVLDWEYAREHANPLADFFHFHLIGAALDGSLRKGRVKRDLLLAKAARHAQEIFGLDGEFAAALATPLLLAYLVDTVSFYATENGGIDRKDPVVDSYLQFITEQK
jgi:Phosphotransferase enzyme family